MIAKKEAHQKISKLKKVINYHRYLYHVLNQQEISDDVLDSLKHELYQLESLFPEFITVDSPTQRVAGLSLKGFKKVKHSTRMLSIEDIFSEEDLKDWKNYLKKLIPSQKLDYFTELKIDGFAVTLIYKKGVFWQGATRGNGTQGEDVTQNLKTIESIPLKLEPQFSLKQKTKLSRETKEKIKILVSRGTIEVRGEVYMEKGDFEKLNRGMIKKGEKTFANPRNLAAGSIRQLNPKMAASRPLKFLAYDVITDFGQKKHSESHQILSILGFKTDQGLECKSLKEITGAWKKATKKRDSFPFQIDGLVININNNLIFKKLGVIGKSPRGIRAFKFSPKEAVTIVKDIKIQVGRTGALTPVAILEPVKIEGVVVSRATLHNADEIKRLDVRIQDTVSVIRAGDVIPAVTKVFVKLRSGKEKKFKMPKTCPSCKTKLVKGDKDVVWRCPNRLCFDRKKEYFSHFVSRGAFDIVGLGPKIISRIIDKGLVSDPADFFKLKEGDILLLDRFGEKSARNLVDALKAKKRITLPRFIYAMGISNVGEQTARLLADKFGSLDKIKKTSRIDLEKIKDIGSVVSSSIYKFFHEESSLRFIKKLKECGIEIQDEKVKTKGLKLKGLNFVLTGTLTSTSRSEAKSLIRSLGGKISESISKNTNYLIVGQKAGSKLKKAQKIGVKIINEKEFINIVKE